MLVVLQADGIRAYLHFSWFTVQPKPQVTRYYISGVGDEATAEEEEDDDTSDDGSVSSGAESADDPIANVCFSHGWLHLLLPSSCYNVITIWLGLTHCAPQIWFASVAATRN